MRCGLRAGIAGCGRRTLVRGAGRLRMWDRYMGGRFALGFRPPLQVLREQARKRQGALCKEPAMVAAREWQLKVTLRALIAGFPNS